MFTNTLDLQVLYPKSLQDALGFKCISQRSPRSCSVAGFRASIRRATGKASDFGVRARFGKSGIPNLTGQAVEREREREIFEDMAYDTHISSIHVCTLLSACICIFMYICMHIYIFGTQFLTYFFLLGYLFVFAGVAWKYTLNPKP